MSELQPNPPHSFSVRSDQPLIGVIVQEGEEEIVRYFTDDQQVDQAVRQRPIQRAQSLAGAWQDLDWEPVLDELDRIRHESRPAPPIDP